MTRSFSTLLCSAAFTVPCSAQQVEIADLDPSHILETFDTFAGGPLADELIAFGVRFENAQVQVGASFPVSPPNVIRAIDDSKPLQILFDLPALEAGIQIDTDGYNSSRQPAARFFNVNGKLLETIQFGQGPDFVGYRHPAGIGRIELVDLRSAGHSDPKDDFRFFIDPNAWCGPADLAEPFGLLDLADINAFTAGFLAMDPIADLTADGLFDLGDINLFVEAFVAGCP